MKRLRRFGVDWWHVSEQEMLDIAPKMRGFIVLAPLLLWDLIRLFDWLFAKMPA